MDPNRTAVGATPQPAVPMRGTCAAILREHRRRFLISSFPSWAVTTVVVLPIWVVLAFELLARGGSWPHLKSWGWALLVFALLLEVMQACVYIVVPRRAWGAASSPGEHKVKMRSRGRTGGE